MADTKPPRRQKQKELRPQPAPNSDAERLKTVVRRLPPNLPEEIFWQSVQAWVTDDTVTWKSYYPGKFRTKRMNKEGIPSRAYIAFKSEELVATFSREYDGHVFRDKAGNESQAIVEFAPFQKVPTEKKKADARNNTIDKDEDYLSFLESLKNGGKTESVSLEALIAASQSPPPPTTTPLLESLKAEKSAQRDKEAILRNHAHYKDVGAPSKKDEAKKKAAAAAAQAAKQQSSEPAAPLSKKAKKAAAAAAAVANAVGGAGAVAAQKTPSTQVQAHDEQGSATGKTQPAGAVPSIAKLPTPASVAGHGPRHRPPRAHAGRGDPPAPLLSVPVTLGSGASSAHSPQGPVSPAPTTTDHAPSGIPTPVPAQGQRKSRPVVGLGRQLEAALSGAGVAVSSGPGGDRKKRDKGGEAGLGTGTGDGKRKHREDGPPGGVVPSILQRPEMGGGPDVVIMQRPHSPKVESGGHGTAEGGTGGTGPSGVGRGSGRRGRRGRGGNRGG